MRTSGSSIKIPDICRNYGRSGVVWQGGTPKGVNLQIPSTKLQRNPKLQSTVNPARVWTLPPGQKISFLVHFGFAFQIASISGEPWLRTPLSVKISSVAATISLHGKIKVSPAFRQKNSIAIKLSFESRTVSTRSERFLTVCPLMLLTTCGDGLPYPFASLCGKNGDETKTIRSFGKAASSPYRVMSGLPE